MLSEILNACRQGRADVEAYIVADAVKGASLFFFFFFLLNDIAIEIRFLPTEI